MHLRILKDAGRLHPAGLDALGKYLERYWNRALSGYVRAGEEEMQLVVDSEREIRGLELRRWISP